VSIKTFNNQGFDLYFKITKEYLNLIRRCWYQSLLGNNTRTVSTEKKSEKSNEIADKAPAWKNRTDIFNMGMGIK